MKNIRTIIIYFFTIFLICSTSWAADYYVDAARGNDSNPGTLSSSWKSISKANNTLRAGDTVFIRGGSYTGQQIRPGSSGTANSRIVYRNYNGETPVITQSDDPLNLSSRSYITVHGMTIRDCDKYLTMDGGNYNHIEYCTITDMRTYKRFGGFFIGANSSYNWVHHNRISEYGNYTATKDQGDMVHIGGSSPGSNSRNLIEDNHFCHGGHNVFSVTSPYNVIRNNYMHNDEWKNGYGGRIATIKGAGNGKWNLIEGNHWAFSGMPPDNDYSPGIKIVSPDNIVRFNKFYNNKGPGIQLVYNTNDGPTGSDRNYIYSNVFYNNGVGGVDGKVSQGIFMKGVSGPLVDNVIKNNLFYKNPSSMAYTGTGSMSANEISNNWEQTGDPLFANLTIGTMCLTDSNYSDFSLRSNSPCVDKGAFLTRTASSGSGTKIQVQDAHYFMDGWGIIEGDRIQLENRSDTARIVSVDYAKNILTIDKSLTWSAGQGVALPYSGSAPDMGSGEQSSGNQVNLLAPANLRVVK